MSVSKWRESVVMHFGLLPKCMPGNKWYFSVRCEISSAMLDDRRFTMVFSSVMGLYAFGRCTQGGKERVVQTIAWR